LSLEGIPRLRDCCVRDPTAGGNGIDTQTFVYPGGRGAENDAVRPPDERVHDLLAGVRIQ
jgi:hypothetical protein